MKITKLGHCCLVIEENGLKILADPGSYTIEEQRNVNNIDVILITHEHQDHLHVDSLKEVLKNNLGAKVLTNSGVAKVLGKERITFGILGHNQSVEIRGVRIEGWGEKHAEIYKSLAPVPNTGYLVAGKFFYPGDALTIPPRPISVLALPVAGPWLKLSEAIDYAISVKPATCFSVHDGILKSVGSTDRIPAQVLPPIGIEFKPLELGKEYEF